MKNGSQSYQYLLRGNTRAMRYLLLFLLIAATSAVRAQESRIELRTHYSTILGIQKYFNVFLPDGYDRDSLRYPVVYLFRGHESEWVNPSQDGSRQGNIKTVADRLFASGTIGKMIFVMPGLSQPGVDADFAYVVNELIPFVDSQFRTIAVRQKRGMDGFSYGGYDMLQLLRRYPEQFFTAGAYDGSFWVVDLNVFFSSATEAYWTELRSMKFLIHSTVQGNYDSNQQFLSILNSHGINNAFAVLDIGPGSAHNWYFADLHMEKSLPLHWQHFLMGSRTLSARLVSPLPGTKISGTVPVRWSVEPHSEILRVSLDYSRDRGMVWQEIYSSASPDTSFLWNTSLVPDGTGYLIRMRAVGDTVSAYTQMAGRFTVDNPGNAPPEVGIIFPDSSRPLSGRETVSWWAEDADGDSLAISIDASADGGNTWNRLSDQVNTGAFSWDTPASPNSLTYQLRVRAKDAASFGEAMSPIFAVSNMRPTLRDTLTTHVAGRADGTIRVNVVNLSQITGHRYRVIFQDSIPKFKTYSVIDIDRSTTVLARASVGTPNMEGPIFDGLRLAFGDMDPPRYSKDSTRWTSGASDLIPAVTLPRFDPGTGVVTGLPHASDYLIRQFDHTVDTSSSDFGWTPLPMNFTVWNRTENHRVDVLFTDLDNDRLIGHYDDLILLEKDNLGKSFPTWELFFAGTINPTPPLPGDTFLLKILKPFTKGDVYEFLALPTGVVSVHPLSLPLAFRLEQNYPNPFNPMTAVRFQLPVVSDVKLAVFDILGREVAMLVNERKDAGTHQVSFDAKGLASGVYLYRITAGPYTETKKLVLLK
jgi:enterochelin esterase-like enzyme